MGEVLSMPTDDTSTFLSRTSDYLGDLGTKLRNLIGFGTLAYELIQNADDASNATAISFDVGEDCLVVDNDGTFTDCGYPVAKTCPWKQDPARNHRCDFHSFRLVASGDKRDRHGTTGAFGIGFIAVYQITDRPELISAGRHWILREEEPEDKRIKVCSGCPSCRSDGLPGTRFILPFVFDPDSALRRALRVSALKPESSGQLRAELCRVLPDALIFLKRIKRIGLNTDGRVLLRLDRIEDGDTLLISDGSEDRVWHLLRGDFQSAATALKASEPFRIEEKRSGEVALAIPAETAQSGLLCACLPTQQETGLPFHVNADFFPTNDRKGIVFEADYQSEWNRAAIHAAARTLKDNLERLPTLLGHERLWELLFTVHQVHDEAFKGKREQSLGTFWKEISGELRNARYGYSAASEWHKSCDVLLLGKEEENEAAPILEALGLPTLHSSLRPFIFQLPRKEVFGIEQVELAHIISALRQHQFDIRREARDFAKYFPSENELRALWLEIGRLLAREGKPDRGRLEKDLSACALVLGRDGALWPCRDIYRADKDTIGIFSRISPTIPFAADLSEDAAVVWGLCPLFDAKEAIQRLSGLVADGSLAASRDVRLEPNKLLVWFEARQDEILHSEDLKSKIKALPIFPCSSGLKPLTQLALPGGFVDPIGLTDLVDLSVLGGRQDFLCELGANELTFEEYARLHIPTAFRDPYTDPAKKEKAVRLLSDRLGSIKDRTDVRRTLNAVPIISCADRIFRKPAEVYIPSEAVSVVLGETAHLAALPSENRDAFRDLYRWLGVEERPRFVDVKTRVQSLVEIPPDEVSIRAVQAVVSYLGRQLSDYDELPPELALLGALAWLPARGTRTKWFRPSEVHSTFSAYLFESQGQFLDVTDEVQKASTGLLRLLGVKIYPTAGQVVKHLLHCVEHGLPVNPEVYSFLNRNSREPALEALKSQPCLYLPNGTFAKPSQVYWGAHPFGRFRHRLGPDLRIYDGLLSRLGVHESPSPHDTIGMLKQLAFEFGRPHRKLDAEARAVVIASWRLLSESLEKDQLQPNDLTELGSLEVIPNALDVLQPPEWMFFEDRAGLAEKFGDFLRPNVVTRILGAWPAMAAAGVRSLRSAVESELIECSTPVAEELISQRVLQRRHQLARVVEPQAGVPAIKPDLTKLDHIQFVSVTRLEVRYCLKFFHHSRESLSEYVPAHLRTSEHTLFFCRREGEPPPWASIAREIAQAICPEQEPGTIASGIKEVLAAEDIHTAASVLNELGFPPLQAAMELEPTQGPLIGSLGGDAGFERPSVDSRESSIVQPNSDSTPNSGWQGQPEDQELDSGQSIEKREPRRERGRLRTYVTPDDPQKASKPDSVVASRRNEVERAGVQRVKEFEINGGRFPNEMPPNHPGYDVESYDESGQIERYIEVKACSGDWDSLGVAVSDTQFEKAYLERDKFWLYVVERAEQDDFEIHLIRDPARSVDEFFYDHGWRRVAEITKSNRRPTEDEAGE